MACFSVSGPWLSIAGIFCIPSPSRNPNNYASRRWTPHPGIATARDRGDCSRVLLYALHSAITGKGGAHLNYLKLTSVPIRSQVSGRTQVVSATRQLDSDPLWPCRQAVIIPVWCKGMDISFVLGGIPKASAMCQQI